MAKRKSRSKALVRVETGPADTSLVGVMGRMALDPRLTPEKLEKLIDLQLKVNAVTAAAQFEDAYRQMAPFIPRISKRGEIKNREGKVQSRYSKYEDIRKIIDPILARFGFSLAFNTEWPEGKMETVAVLTHAGGHAKRSAFRSEADGSGGKNAIQGIGSARSYGQRYGVKDLLAIVEEGEDTDGHKRPARGAPVQAAPDVVPSTERITLAQRGHLSEIVNRRGRKISDVSAWLLMKYDVESSREITQDKFEEITKAIEAPGPLAVA